MSLLWGRYLLRIVSEVSWYSARSPSWRLDWGGYPQTNHRNLEYFKLQAGLWFSKLFVTILAFIATTWPSGAELLILESAGLLDFGTFRVAEFFRECCPSRTLPASHPVSIQWIGLPHLSAMMPKNPFWLFCNYYLLTKWFSIDFGYEFHTKTEFINLTEIL